MLYTIISLVLLFWLVGVLSHFGGGFIHGLLLVAGALFLLEIISGRRAV